MFYNSKKRLKTNKSNDLYDSMKFRHDMKKTNRRYEEENYHWRNRIYLSTEGEKKQLISWKKFPTLSYPEKSLSDEAMFQLSWKSTQITLYSFGAEKPNPSKFALILT